MRLITFLLALVLFSSLSYASSKIIAPVKKEIRIEADAGFKYADYTWTLISDKGEVLDTQSSKIYTQKFTVPGVYTLNLSGIEKNTGEIKATTTHLVIGKSQKFFDDLVPSVETIPVVDDQGEIAFPTKSGTVTLYLANSKGVKNYEIDHDALIDSDDDDDPANDIDNIKDTSYVDGGSYSINYEGAEEAILRIRFLGNNEEVKSLDYKVVFNKKEALPIAGGKPKAVIKTLPRYNLENKEVYVPFGINEVYIYGADSSGNMLKYRIDEDINSDSSGDGKPDNDIDNLEHPSYQDGSIYGIKKGKKPFQVVQLTVVSGKKGSAVRRKIVWGTENTNKVISIYSSSDQALVDGDIFFGITGIDEEKNYQVEWDFDGDGKVDKKNRVYVQHSYDDPGSYEVTAKIKSDNGSLVKLAKLDIEVRSEIESNIRTKKPIVDFDYIINGSYVEFVQNVQIDPNILNREYGVLWKFGDGNISNENDPNIIYPKLGTYDVELIATDSHGKVGSVRKKVIIDKLSLENWIDTGTGGIGIGGKQENVDIPNGLDGSGEAEKEDEIPMNESEDDNKNDVVINKGSSGFGTIIWILIIIFGGGIVALIAYVVFQKIKHPDYSFGEIIEEEREKLLSFIEGEEYIPPAGKISSDIQQGVSDVLESEDAEKKDDKEEGVNENVSKDDSSIEDTSAEEVDDHKIENESEDKKASPEPDSDKLDAGKNKTLPVDDSISGGSAIDTSGFEEVDSGDSSQGEELGEEKIEDKKPKNEILDNKDDDAAVPDWLQDNGYDAMEPKSEIGSEQPAQEEATEKINSLEETDTKDSAFPPPPPPPPSIPGESGVNENEAIEPSGKAVSDPGSQQENTKDIDVSEGSSSEEEADIPDWLKS